MLNQRLGHGCFAGTACHRPWDLGNVSGSSGVCITSKYTLSEKAIKKDGAIKKAFRVRIASALLGHEDSKRWLEERGCALVRA